MYSGVERVTTRKPWPRVRPKRPKKRREISGKNTSARAPEATRAIWVRIRVAAMPQSAWVVKICHIQSAHAPSAAKSSVSAALMGWGMMSWVKKRVMLASDISAPPPRKNGAAKR